MMALVQVALMFLVLILAIFIPLFGVVVIAFAVKWGKIFFGIIMGDDKVIDEIKSSTCGTKRKKDESWGDWWVRLFDGLVLPQHEYDRNHKPHHPPHDPHDQSTWRHWDRFR